MRRKGASVDKSAPPAAAAAEPEPAEDPQEEAGGGTVGDPGSWDAATKREWAAFVAGSRAGEGQWWDPRDVDQGLPQVYVDLDKE